MRIDSPAGLPDAVRWLRCGLREVRDRMARRRRQWCDVCFAGVPQEPVRSVQADATPRGERRVWLRGWASVPVFEFDDLAPGQPIAGPSNRR